MVKGIFDSKDRFLNGFSQCIGPHALSQICKLFAEEYGHRTGGIPDLW
jgi:hypothetical protein